MARIARRYMPRLKTESEVSEYPIPAPRPYLTLVQVATINYIRQHTDIPVPIIYHFDSNPFNRLGGEYILMSKVRAHTFHSHHSLTL